MLVRRALLAAAALAACASAAMANPVLSGDISFDNYGFAYLSTSPDTLGTEIGSAAGWSPGTAITPQTLVPGTTYYLNIEAINGDTGSYSDGGFLGAFSLTSGATFGNGTQTALTGGSGWSASYNDSNNTDVVQAWVAPTGTVTIEGSNGISPWNSISGISGSADWVWATNASDGSPPGDQCAGCTVDFQIQINVPAVPEPSGVTLLLLGGAALGWLRKRRPASPRPA